MATEKQKRAVKKTLENGGNVSKAMKESGYRDSVAKNPKKLTESKGWEELMEENLSDEELMEVHKEGLRAIKKEHKIIDRDEDGKPVYDFVDVEDYVTRHKYLDTGYKLKGKYAPTESKISGKLDIKQIAGSKIIKDDGQDNTKIQDKDR